MSVVHQAHELHHSDDNARMLDTPRYGAAVAPGTGARGRVRSLALLMLLVPVLLVLTAVPAATHAVLLDTDPADGAELDEAPAVVTLQFNEPVDLPAGAVEVLDAEGERVDEGEPTHGEERSQVQVGLEDQADGAYIVSWQVVSADTHPVSGSFVFTVGDADPSEVDAGEFTDDDGAQVGVASSVTRAVMYAGSLLAVGGAVFVLFVAGSAERRSRASRTVVLGAAGVAAAATVLGVPLQAAEASGRALTGLVDPTALEQVVLGPLGVASGVRLVGLLVLVAGVLALPRRRGPVVALLGGLVVLGSFLATGHTITSEPRSVVMAANLAHTAAAAVWSGGLVLLAISLRQRKRAEDAEGGAAIVARFSSVALVSVLAVAASGLALAWAEVRALAPLFTTAYGLVLLTKVGLVAAVLGVAAYNRQRLVPAVRRQAGRAQRVLDRTVRIEIVGIVAVVAATGFLVNLTPPRGATGADEPVIATAQLGPDQEVAITVEPGDPGHNQVEIWAYEQHAEHEHDPEHFADLHAEAGVDLGDEVSVEFTNQEAGIEPISREPEQLHPGHYSHTGAEMSVPGTWTIRVEARVSEFEQFTAEVDVDIE